MAWKYVQIYSWTAYRLVHQFSCSLFWTQTVWRVSFRSLLYKFLNNWSMNRNITSTDSYYMGFFGFGEGWHNYHVRSTHINIFTSNYLKILIGFLSTVFLGTIKRQNCQHTCSTFQQRSLISSLWSVGDFEFWCYRFDLHFTIFYLRLGHWLENRTKRAYQQSNTANGRWFTSRLRKIDQKQGIAKSVWKFSFTKPLLGLWW